MINKITFKDLNIWLKILVVYLSFHIFIKLILFLSIVILIIIKSIAPTLVLPIL